VPHDANAITAKKTFQSQYTNKGALPQTKLLIAKMATNGSGIRDTARVLDISPNTVIKVLKKQKTTKQTQIPNTPPPNHSPYVRNG
jgi:transposase-like protein